MTIIQSQLIPMLPPSDIQKSPKNRKKCTAV